MPSPSILDILGIANCRVRSPEDETASVQRLVENVQPASPANAAGTSRNWRRAGSPELQCDDPGAGRSSLLWNCPCINRPKRESSPKRGERPPLHYNGKAKSETFEFGREPKMAGLPAISPVRGSGVSKVGEVGGTRAGNQRPPSLDGNGEPSRPDFRCAAIACG
jgi:hypothetical protein